MIFLVNLNQHHSEKWSLKQIKGAMGFVVGAVGEAPRNLEDFGYLMERIILLATDAGLGTCWLGGSFTRSRFAKKISATNGESVPAVFSVGYSTEPRLVETAIRRRVTGDRRLPWEQVFFDQQFGAPLSPETYAAR